MGEFGSVFSLVVTASSVAWLTVDALTAWEEADGRPAAMACTDRSMFAASCS